VDILTGAKVSWINAFWASFKEKSVGKLVPSAVVAALSIYYFVPGAPAISSAIIALVAMLVGVVAEAALAARGTEFWKWKESQQCRLDLVSQEYQCRRSKAIRWRRLSAYPRRIKFSLILRGLT
jgi:hypothetical protein